MRTIFFTLTGLFLLGLATGCGHEEVEMPDNPAPPPSEPPNAVMGDAPTPEP